MSDFDSWMRILDELAERCGGALRRGEGAEFEAMRRMLSSALFRQRRGGHALLASGRAVLAPDRVHVVAVRRTVAFPDGRTEERATIRSAELAALLCLNYRSLLRLRREGFFPWPVVAARVEGRALPVFLYLAEEAEAVLRILARDPKALNGLARPSRRGIVAEIFAAVAEIRARFGIAEPYRSGRIDPAKQGAGYVSVLARADDAEGEDWDEE